MSSPGVLHAYELAISVGDVHPLLFRRDGELESWLGPRPIELGGTWAIGCRACYGMIHRTGCSSTMFEKRTSTWPGNEFFVSPHHDCFVVVAFLSPIHQLRSFISGVSTTYMFVCACFVCVGVTVCVDV